MINPTPQAPMQVEVVPAAPKPSVEDRIMKHMDNLGGMPTLTPGDTTVRRNPNGQFAKTEAEQAQPATQTEAPAESERVEATETPEEHYEFEFNGGKWQVPAPLKELHEGYLRTQDYTAKTTAAAEKMRQAELMVEHATRQHQLQTALQPKYEVVQQLGQQIKQYEQVDWNAWIAQDPVAAQQGMLRMQMLERTKGKAEQELQTAAQEQMRGIQETGQKLAEENLKILQKDLKGFTPEARKSLNEWAEKTYGFSQSHLSQIYDSRVVKMMHDANKYHELKASAPQKVQQAQKTITPSASKTVDAGKAKLAQLNAAVKSAKTDTERAKAIQARLEATVR